MPIILIACIDINGGLGDSEGNLLFNLPKDMQHFKAVTTGKTIVVGRATWESLPIRPLPKRKNYVLTMNESYQAEGATVIHSIDEVLELAKTKDVYVCGGGEIYYQTIDYADKLIITHVHTVNPNAKVHFPDIEAKEWRISENMTKHSADVKHEFDFTFAEYTRKK